MLVSEREIAERKVNILRHDTLISIFGKLTFVEVHMYFHIFICALDFDMGSLSLVMSLILSLPVAKIPVK